MMNHDDRLLAQKRGTDAHRKAQAILRNRHQPQSPAAAAMASVFGAPVHRSPVADFDDVALSVRVTRISE